MKNFHPGQHSLTNNSTFGYKATNAPFSGVHQNQSFGHQRL